MGVREQEGDGTVYVKCNAGKQNTIGAIGLLPDLTSEISLMCGAHPH